MKLVHACKIPISTLTGGFVLFSFSYFSVKLVGGVPYELSTRGYVAMTSFGAVLGTVYGALAALALSRGTADQVAPRWVQIGIFVALGMCPLGCIPFTMPEELFEFLTH